MAQKANGHPANPGEVIGGTYDGNRAGVEKGIHWVIIRTREDWTGWT